MFGRKRRKIDALRQALAQMETVLVDTRAALVKEGARSAEVDRLYRAEFDMRLASKARLSEARADGTRLTNRVLQLERQLGEYRSSADVPNPDGALELRVKELEQELASAHEARNSADRTIRVQADQLSELRETIDANECWIASLGKRVTGIIYRFDRFASTASRAIKRDTVWRIGFDREAYRELTSAVDETRKLAEDVRS